MKASRGCFDVSGREGGELGARLALHPFGERGPCSNGSRASSDLIANFGYAVGFKAGAKTQHIPAGRVADIDGDRRRIELSDVTRILEMVEQRLGMEGHKPSVVRGNRSGTGSTSSVPS